MRETKLSTLQQETFDKVTAYINENPTSSKKAACSAVGVAYQNYHAACRKLGLKKSTASSTKRVIERKPSKLVTLDLNPPTATSLTSIVPQELRDSILVNQGVTYRVRYEKIA